MKVALVSGFLNDHLLPLCEELNKKCDFRFIATQDLSKTSLQYRDEINKPYVLHYYNPKEQNTVLSEILNDDVIIFGGSSLELLELRKQTGKLSFIYTERFLKKGNWRRFIPSTAKILKQKFLTNNKNLYVLCSGSFVVKDLALIGFDTTKCFKFGYLPNIEHLSFEDLLSQKQNKTLKLLFVGRFLKLKRTIDTLKCCKRLKENGIVFELNILGDGPERKKLENYTKKHKLDNVNFLGSQSKENVLKYMQQSHLSFVNSNRREGWATVINESLSQACPVIASDTCGATAYLIKEDYNGFSYPVTNVSELYEKTLKFINNNDKETFYINAYNTIWEEWSATIAAERFLQITNAILENKSTNLYRKGPLSKI